MPYILSDVLIRAGEILIDGTDYEVKIAQALASAADAIDKEDTWAKGPREKRGEEIIDQIGEVIAAMALYPSNDRARWNPARRPASADALEVVVAGIGAQPARYFVDAASALEAAHAYLEGVDDSVTMSRIPEALKLLRA
jgi:hypothetical protein